MLDGVGCFFCFIDDDDVLLFRWNSLHFVEKDTLRYLQCFFFGGGIRSSAGFSHYYYGRESVLLHSKRSCDD